MLTWHESNFYNYKHIFSLDQSVIDALLTRIYYLYITLIYNFNYSHACSARKAIKRRHSGSLTVKMTGMHDIFL